MYVLVIFRCFFNQKLVLIFCLGNLVFLNNVFGPLGLWVFNESRYSFLKKNKIKYRN
jgi:hypothetical protein